MVVNEDEELISLEQVIAHLALSQRVYLVAYALGMSENECYSIVAGYHDGAFAGILGKYFLDAKALIDKNRAEYVGQARRLWRDTTLVMEEGYRLKVAITAMAQVHRKPRFRDEFIIKEASKLAVGGGRVKLKVEDKSHKKNGDGDLGHDELILARAAKELKRKKKDKPETGEDDGSVSEE